MRALGRWQHCFLNHARRAARRFGQAEPDHRRASPLPVLVAPKSSSLARRPDSDVRSPGSSSNRRSGLHASISEIELQLSPLAGGRRIDLRTAGDLSGYFREEVVNSAAPHMSPEDRIRLRHMIDALESVDRFVTGRHREDLGTDEMLSFAIARALEVVGEAAARLSEETRTLGPGGKLVRDHRHAQPPDPCVCPHRP